MFNTIPTFFYLPLIIIVLCWISNRLLVAKPLPGIPYNKFANWMPFGDLFSLGVHSIRTGSSFDWLSFQCLKLNSPIVQIMVPSFSTTTPALLIADLREVRNIIVKRVHEIDRASLIHFWFEVVVPCATTSMQTTPSFKRQRRLWNCMLDPDFLENVATPAFEATIRRTIELWSLKAKISNGSAFAAYNDLRRTTLEGIWKVLLGRELELADASIGQLQQKRDINTSIAAAKSFPHFFEDFILLLTGMLWVVTGISPRIYKWLFNLYPPFGKAMKRTKSLFKGFIEETREDVLKGSTTTRSGLSDALRQSDNTVSDESMIDELLELLITGHETTASTTAWGLKYLSDHQDIQQKLYDVLKRTFPEASIYDLPRGSDISHVDIPYLDAVLAEILRLACTGPVLFRETLTDTEIMGHHVPANTPVFLITQSPPSQGCMISPDTFNLEGGLGSKLGKDFIAQDKALADTWGTSFEEFVPDRWVDCEGKFDSNAGLSLPFSAGKRGCFGKRIAMLELKLLISMLVLSFHFVKLPKSMSSYNSNDSLTRQPACCFVKPVPREG